MPLRNCSDSIAKSSARGGWLNGALNALAQANAKGPVGRTRLLRDMHAQTRTVDQRRVQIARRIAELDRRLDH
jgi:hypothetical protein